MIRYVPLILALGACAVLPANIDPPAPDSLAERFELITFFSEFSDDEFPLARWRDGSIRIHALAADSGPYRPDIARLADDLGAITGRRIYLVGGSQQADIVVLMDTRQNIRDALEAIPGFESRIRLAMRAPCYAVFYSGDTDTPHTIDGAIVSIHRMRSEQARRCLAQEITQALGLPNDIDDPDGTVFSSHSTRTTLSESDRNIVRILYDPRLQPGMTRAEAMPIVRQIAAELEAQQAATQ